MIATYVLVTAALALTGPLGPAKAASQLPGIVALTKKQPLEVLHRRTIELRLDSWTVQTHGLLATPYASTVNFTLYDVTVEDRDDIDVKMTIGETEGIVMTISASMVRLRGKIRLEEQKSLWKRKRGNTNFTATLSDIQMTMKRTVTPTDNNRQLVWRSDNVSAIVGAVDLDLSDRELNRWQAQISDLDMKKFVVDCLTDPSFYDNLTTITTYSFHSSSSNNTNNTEELHPNMTILRPPAVKDGVIAMEYRGNVLFDGDGDVKPAGDPKPFDRLTLNNHQAIRISKFTFETLGNMVHKHQLLFTNFTKADLPKQINQILDMNCSGVCFGTLLPNASRLHPGATASMTVRTAKAPVFKITPNAFSCLFQFIVTASVTKNSSTVHLFTARLQFSVEVELRVENDRMLFKPLHSNSIVSVDSTSIGDIPGEVLRALTSHAMHKAMMPVATRMGEQGVNVRLFYHSTISNYKFVLKEKSVDLLMDVVYKKKETEPSSRNN